MKKREEIHAACKKVSYNLCEIMLVYSLALATEVNATGSYICLGYDTQVSTIGNG